MMRLNSWRLVALAVLAVSVAAASCGGAEEKTAEKKAEPAKEAAPYAEKEKSAEAQTPAATEGEKAAEPAGGEEPASDEEGYLVGARPVKPKKAPDRIQVQHILIGFKGSVPGKNITRTKEEAKTLAYELLEKAWKGENFNTLVATHTNDAAPGIYAMSNSGVQPNQGEFSRDGMVGAFGDVGFNISAGNIGIADYDPQKSPYGWHIIKRLK